MPYKSVLGINSDNVRAKAIVKLHFLPVLQVKRRGRRVLWIHYEKGA